MRNGVSQQLDYRIVIGQRDVEQIIQGRDDARLGSRQVRCSPHDSRKSCGNYGEDKEQTVNPPLTRRNPGTLTCDEVKTRWHSSNRFSHIPKTFDAEKGRPRSAAPTN